MSKIHRVVQLDYWTSPGTGQRMLTVTGPKGAQQTFMLAGEIAPSVDPVQLAAANAELLAILKAIVRLADIGELDHCVSTRLGNGEPDVRDVVKSSRTLLAKHKGAGA